VSNRRSDCRGHRRSRTIGVRYMEAALDKDVDPDDEPITEQRPRTRGECVDGPRPCPWVSCRYHLYLEVTRAGGLTLRFPDLQPDELEHSCALDLADSGPKKLIQISEVLNVTRERVRQLEVKAYFSAKAGALQLRIHNDVLDGFAHPTGQRAEDAA